MADELNIFSFLKGMTIEKRDFDFDDVQVNKQYSQYSINRWLSMVDLFVPLVNEINKCSNLDNKTHYEMYKDTLPQESIFFKYIKRKKDVNEIDKLCLMKYFDITKREAEMYIEVLSEKQIKEIVSIYNKDQIKDIVAQKKKWGFH